MYSAAEGVRLASNVTKMWYQAAEGIALSLRTLTVVPPYTPLVLDAENQMVLLNGGLKSGGEPAGTPRSSNVRNQPPPTVLPLLLEMSMERPPLFPAALGSMKNHPPTLILSASLWGFIAAASANSTYWFVPSNLNAWPEIPGANVTPPTPVPPEVPAVSLNELSADQL